MKKRSIGSSVSGKVAALVVTGVFIFGVLVVSGYFRPVSAFNGSPLLIQAAFAADDCFIDADGANDEPGQKDVTKACIERQSSDPLHITWNWDIVSLSGTNSADACALFDTDLNGFADYSLCNSWRGNPPTQITRYPVLYSCGDTRSDRCANSAPVAITYGSTCSIINGNTSFPYEDPFTAGYASPYDTVSECNIALGDVGFPVYPVNLLDVCSYPSLQPNSDPSDCVITSHNRGNLEIHKDVVPDDITTKWDISVAGPTPFTDTLTGDDTTWNKLVDAGTYSITETAGSGSSLTGYSSTWSCTKSSVTPPVTTSGTGTSITGLAIVNGDIWDCTFTNVANADIAVTKSDGDYSIYPYPAVGIPYKYTVTITNSAASAKAYNVNMVDTLDPYLDYISDTDIVHPITIDGVTAGSSCAWVDDAIAPSGAGGTLTCGLGNLATGQAVTVEYWVVAVTGVPTAGTIEIGDSCTIADTSDVCNTVAVTTTTTETNTTNNIASEPKDIGSPTAVDLGWFEVTRVGKNGITLGWETLSEFNNLGFNLYRSTSLDGTKKKINAEIILCVNPGSTEGAVYSYKDKGLKQKKTYYYWLEAVDLDGTTSLDGPVSAKVLKK